MFSGKREWIDCFSLVKVIMRSRAEMVSKLYGLARNIDLHHKDRKFYEGAFHILLWTLDLESVFQKSLLPETIVRSAVGKTYSKTNYQKTLDRIFNQPPF